MITLVDATKATGCETVLRNMFAARKEVFVDLLGWRIPVLDGRFEIDQFDDEHARYLLLTDTELGHLGSARLLPTMRPHILDTLFPELCGGPVPRDPAIYEITRFCLDRRLGAGRRRDVRNRLVTALAAHGLANGIRAYTGVAELGWLGQILAFGWEAAQLGEPLACHGKPLGALRIEIDASTEALLSANGMWLPTHPMSAPEAVSA